MKLERRHGLLVIGVMGVLGASLVFSRAEVAAKGQVMIPSEQMADWEGVDYPALDRLIAERVAAARAKDALQIASR